ncbi:hypothetical protein [Corynebacterium auris]|uniref:hypothetical protein n=1 Tax=Corynebacterium auris TaxID=44750 RepID=UPI0025B55478|nr:hypothetical protein [Corynebacterium auris]WJY68829.1 hypothetical protein CAURIS_09775 [Corynebacterium auris]
MARKRSIPSLISFAGEIFSGLRPATDVGSLDDLDVIGARIEARHHDGGVVTADNQGGRGDSTPGMAGFDY